MSAPSDKVSAWSPLRSPVFRAFWIAIIISNVGTWMQNVGAAWLMTSLSHSEVMVALVQTATSLPVFFFALPAGALADVVDRRRLLLVTQGWMLLMALILGVLTLLDRATPWTLLLLTFSLGIGAAMNAPAWQATIPDLIPREDLPAAVALGSVGFNIARAVGPALGGMAIAASGPGGAFMLNAVSFVGVLAVLCRWKSRRERNALPTERFVGAIRAGLRYVRHAPQLRAVLIRAGVFILCGAALWALLPLRSRNELGYGATGYGILLGCIGAGALIGAGFLPKLRSQLAGDRLISCASLLFGAATLGLAFLNNFILLCGAMLLGGFAWMTVMSSFNVAAMMTAPAWVKSRALSLYQLVFQGGLAIGSAVWGTVATHTSLTVALVGAAAGLALGLVAVRRFPLAPVEPEKFEPSQHWEDPVVARELEPDRGPVVVTVEYRIDPAKANEFTAAMRPVREFCLRDGAIQWTLLNDTSDPPRYVEYFVVESWAEHLRQHERVTIADRAVQDYARSFHIGDKPPAVSHFIAENIMNHQRKA
jgi:MFS family permease